ncbi:MAG: hypothetical protein WD749_08445 [Phycisphaerales bacterium]
MPTPAATPAESPLSRLTLAISGFGADRAAPRILLDWFRFLGGRPAEVVYVDGGSARTSTRVLTSMLHRGLIDRLELLNPRHWENSYDRCYIQEYRAGRLATRPYIMFVKLDMLTWRQGHARWLEEDMARLDQPGVFAITNSHLIDPPTGREGPYLRYDFASLNFALMKREAWERAMREQIGGFIDAEFRGPFPAHIQAEERWRRALVEWAWQSHCRANGLRTLARAESSDWTIFHVNKTGRRLLALRKRFLAREGIEAFFDQPKMRYRPPHTGPARAGRALEGAVRGLRSLVRPRDEAGAPR